jgi:hypothetical protein
MLAALALRVNDLQPTLVQEPVNRLSRLLSTIHRIPAAYRAELAPAAACIMQALVDNLGRPPADAFAVGTALRAMARLRPEVPGATLQRLREHALGAVREEQNSVPLYWVVRAMNEGCIGAPDNDAVEAVLRWLAGRTPDQLLSLFQELRKVTLDGARWVQKHKTARYLWVRPLPVVPTVLLRLQGTVAATARYGGSTCLALLVCEPRVGMMPFWWTLQSRHRGACAPPIGVHAPSGARRL